jgi:hypothetical protein
MMQKEPPKLSKTLFWDVDFEQIDYDRRARYVIERVVMYGNWDEWQEIKRYYGLEKIKVETMQVRYLDGKTLSFLSQYFQVQKKEFRCYTWQQSNPLRWDS